MTELSAPIWFQLVDAHGEPYMNASADAVFVPSGSLLFQFRDAVKAKNSNKLSSVDAADLKVYANKAAFDKRNAEEGKEEPLKSSHPLEKPEEPQEEALGRFEEEALIIVVPSPPEVIVNFIDGTPPQSQVGGFIYQIARWFCIIPNLVFCALVSFAFAIAFAAVGQSTLATVFTGLGGTLLAGAFALFINGQRSAPQAPRP